MRNRGQSLQLEKLFTFCLELLTKDLLLLLLGLYFRLDTMNDILGVILLNYGLLCRRLSSHRRRHRHHRNLISLNATVVATVWGCKASSTLRYRVIINYFIWHHAILRIFTDLDLVLVLMLHISAFLCNIFHDRVLLTGHLFFLVLYCLLHQYGLSSSKRIVCSGCYTISNWLWFLWLLNINNVVTLCVAL